MKYLSQDHEFVKLWSRIWTWFSLILFFPYKFFLPVEESTTTWTDCFFILEVVWMTGILLLIFFLNKEGSKMGTIIWAINNPLKFWLETNFCSRLHSFAPILLLYSITFLHPGHKQKSNNVAWIASYFLFCLDQSFLFHHSYSHPQELCSMPTACGLSQLATLLPFWLVSLLLFPRSDNIYSFPKCVWNKQKLLTILISPWWKKAYLVK